jgi:hypothetical protein
MTNEDIVGGLRQALSKGDSLEKAMTSFFNAGYAKEDIENAANSLYASPWQTQADYPTQQQQQPTPQTQQQNIPQQKTPITYPQSQQQQPQQQMLPHTQSSPAVVQKVSDYGKKPSKTGMVITVILFILFILLLGILASVIFFKDELSDFFTNLLLRALF